MGTIGPTEAQPILNGFTARWSAAAPITPTLLFAYEDSYRAVNDSPESQANASMAWSGSQTDRGYGRHRRADHRRA